MATRSGSYHRLDNYKVHLVAVPLRFLPLVSSIMFTVIIFLFLPILILTSKSDVVVMSPDFTVLGSFPSIFLSKIKKTKFMLDIRSIPVEVRGFQGFLQKLWFNLSVKIAGRLFNGFTIITPLMKTDFCRSFNINPEKVGVWTSGVSTELFDPEKWISQRENFRKELGLEGKFVVMYHGVFTETRGLVQTMDSINMLSDKYSDIVFVLLGTGPIVLNLKELIKEQNLQKNIIIMNPVEQVQVPKYISMCDIGIVPLPNHQYWRSQSPLKLLEYLAMEKVAVLTDIPSHRMVVNEDKCAIYISSADPIEIAKGIEYAYVNKSKLNEWGKIGREIVKREYTWEKVASDLEKYMFGFQS